MSFSKLCLSKIKKINLIWDFKLITSKKLLKLRFIKHGFFNRNGGKSKGIYTSLNCGLGSNDKTSNIKKNLKIVKKRFGKDVKNIFLINQIHSNKCIFLKEDYYLKDVRPKVDAVITSQRKLPIAILTADCAPILLCDKKKRIIAAIHSGWKGAFKGIITKVIKLMINKGCNKKDIIAAIGPCISRTNYEVKKDFLKKFIKKNSGNKIFFEKRNGLLFFNLPKYVKSQLKLNKITNIDLLNIDTFKYKNNFFSARRSLKQRHDDYGRNISIIMIN